MKYRTERYLFSTLAWIILSSCSAQPDDGWFDLFNGEDLSNWKVKFTGQPLGVNYRDTFLVEDNLLTVSYDNWDEFNGEFGHLFYDEVFSHYLLRIEYRFVDNQVLNGPAWAFRNNGIMLHSQDPATMALPVSYTHLTLPTIYSV